MILSGLATGASWICYFKALSIGNVNKVVAIDKSSTVLCFIRNPFLERQRTYRVKLAGTLLLGIGILLMTARKQETALKAENKKWVVYAALSAVLPP